MVALGFKPNWEPLIVAGPKTTTVRERARCKPGDRLQFFIGMRTKNCRKFGVAYCLSVQPIILNRHNGTAIIRLEGDQSTNAGAGRYARRDGFQNAWHMIGWFEAMHGLPFSGVLIEWTLFQDIKE